MQIQIHITTIERISIRFRQERREFLWIGRESTSGNVYRWRRQSVGDRLGNEDRGVIHASDILRPPASKVNGRVP
ncbi:hypothetical protein U1Q18_034385 [Sarracenia purpurea var. burkii]